MNLAKFSHKTSECGNEYMIIELSELHGSDPLAEMKRASDQLDRIMAMPDEMY